MILPQNCMKKSLLLALAVLILVAFSGCINHNGDNNNNGNNENNGDMMDTWFAYFQSGNSIRVRTAPVTRTGGEINVPRDADWTDRGVAISPGGSGSWDVRLTGALSPCTVVKKNGTFFLYYIGADGNRKSDGGPRHRALGVATSPDGLHFTKRGRILTYLPHNNEEEGIFSAGAFLDINGEIVMYYSALDAGSATSTTVDSDIRLAVSSNGLNFSDKGDVISHANSKIWGYGDELFPVGAFREGSTYYVYYIAKGYGANWDLALAWGPARNNIAGNTKQILEVGSDYAKSGCPVRLSADKIAVSICRNTITQIRTAPITSPSSLSSPVQIYSTRTGGVYLDVAPFPPPTYPCPVCGTIFTSRADLNGHIVSEHPGQVIEAVFYHEKDNSGWITKGLDVVLSTVHNDIRIRNKPAYNIDNRGFLSFDMSTIPDNAIIKSAYIKVMGVTKYSGWHLVVDYSLYGAFGAHAWGRTPEASNIASLPTGPNVWTQSSPFTQVNKRGKSQYRIHEPTASTGFGNFYAGNSPSSPELHVSYMIPETFTETTVTCPICSSTLKLRVSSAESKNIAQICPICGEAVGTGYTVAIITELPWPIYTEKSIICPQCSSELELTISSKPEENIAQVCPVCGAPAD